jgi:hypothetical protein
MKAASRKCVLGSHVATAQYNVKVFKENEGKRVQTSIVPCTARMCSWSARSTLMEYHAGRVPSYG